MSGSRKQWSFRRWRRRWRGRFDRLSLRLRIWTDRHLLSFEKRRAWRRKWQRRWERVRRSAESIGYKLIPHRRDAVPDTRWTRFKQRVEVFIDERVYPVEARVRHGRVLSGWWHEFTSPFRHGNARVRHWMDSFLMPTLTPAGFRKRFFNWKGACGITIVVGGLVAIPFWVLPGWHRHNAEKWAAQSRLLLSRGYYGLAYQNAARVLRHDRHHVEASRIVADMQDRQGLPEAIAWRRRVLDGDKAVSNQLALAATALKFEPPPSITAARVLASLPDDATNSVLYNTVVAQYETRAGNLGKAESHYQAALAGAPDDPEVEFSLALVRLQMRNPEKIAVGEQALLSLAAQTNMTARALRPIILLATSRGDYARGLEYSTEILNGESPTLEDRLVHLGLLFRKRDPQRESYLETLQVQVSANPVFVSQVAAWMTANGMARDVTQWIGTLPRPIRESDPVLLAQADAFVSLADWSSLDQFLLERPWGTIEFVRQALLARAQRGLGDPRLATTYFRRAKDLAAGMSLRLINLTRMVDSWRWARETDELLWEVFDRYPKETWAADSLLRRHWERDNTEGLRQVFDLQLRRSPNDAYIKNNLTMVMLLLGHDLPRAHRLALEGHEQAPNSSVHTSTYAFSLYLQGRPHEAKTALESLDREMLKTPSIAAYYALIAFADGDTNSARQYLALARPAKLLPEEKALLDQVRSRL